MIINNAESMGLSLGLDRKLFVAAKEIGEWYSQANGGWVLKTVGLVEYWPFRALGVRAGYEFAWLDLAAQTAAGHGAPAGLSLKLGGYAVDLNATYRSSPLRILPGYAYNQLVLLAGLSYAPKWFER